MISRPFSSAGTFGWSRCRNGFAALRRFAPGVALVASILSAQTISPPPVSVLQNSGGNAEGLLFITAQALTGARVNQGPEILDEQGRPVWFSPAPNHLVTDFRLQNYHGGPVITWCDGPNSSDTTPGHTFDIIADAHYQVIAKVHAGNNLNADIHEFQITPDNTALITASALQSMDLSPYGGPVQGVVEEGVVQEIDIPTGKVLFEWRSLPDVAVTESYSALTTTSASPYDYFHINSVCLDTDGNVIVSARHTWTVYKINRATGKIMWRLGGKKSDFTLGTGLPFGWQHDVVAVDGHTLRIFDNAAGGAPPTLPYSRVIWVNHDDQAMTASIVRTITHPAGLQAAAEGSAQALPNGNTLIDWGIAGRISEHDANGQLIFDAREAPGYCSYRAYRFKWAGMPAVQPTALPLVESDGSLTVHAIWNGATQAAQWDVYAGNASDSLAYVTSAAWNGLDTAIPLSTTAGAIQVVAKDATGSVIGTSAIANGQFASAFSTQPASQTISGGGAVVFRAVSNLPGAIYHWQWNSQPLTDGSVAGAVVSGASSSTLMILGASAASGGTYQCVASSFGNSSTSLPATLTIGSDTADSRLVNLSCRASVTNGDGVLIVGFVVGGTDNSAAMPVLLRAAGPALSPLGIAHPLSDPSLSLVSNGDPVANNERWAGVSEISSTAQAVGAFPWSDPASTDAALVTSIRPGAYTAVISSASSNTGVALGEVYDGNGSNAVAASSPKLLNLSARGQVGTDADVLIAGFVISGATSRTVLIRAAGPALSEFGVTQPLATPQLSLQRSNPDGTTTNLGTFGAWGGDAQVAAVAKSVGAFTWSDATSADAAFLVTLPPGAYTATVSGSGSDTGTALVEIYDVP